FHVFGFDHINKSEFIMYPYVDCKQEINPMLIAKLKELYSVEPLAELYFTNISATKTGSYLNFRVQVNNDGLVDAENFYLKLQADNEEIDSFDFKLIPIGTSSLFYVTNEKLPSSTTNKIKLVLEYSGKEYNKANNVVELSV
ncbi:MAG: CARDB domain-containing protein, partial [Nanoarchaeota archaeon]